MHLHKVNQKTAAQTSNPTEANNPITTSSNPTPKLTHKQFILNHAKPIFERTLSWIFCDEIAKAAELLYPYFTLNKTTALAASMVGTNILLGVMIPIQQNAQRMFVEIAFTNPNAFELYRYPLIIFITTKLLIPVIHSQNAISCKGLRENLSYQMRINGTERWLSTMTFLGYGKTKAGENVIDPIANLSKKITEFCETSTNLVNDRMSILSHFLGALFSLYLISGFFEIALLGLNIHIPYLVTISLFFGYTYSFYASKINEIMKQIAKEKAIATDQFGKQTTSSLASHNIQSVAFLNGEDFEIEALKKKIEDIHTIDLASLKPQRLLSALNKILWEYSEVLGIIMQPLTGVANPADALSAGRNFRHIADHAGFWNSKQDTLKNLEQSTKDLQSFMLHTINEYITLIKNCKIKYSYYKNIDSQSIITIPLNLMKLMPESSKIFDEFDVPHTKVKINLTIPTKDNTDTIVINSTLKPGKIYRLIGPNGAGKTTLLKLLKGGMEPTLGSGNIEMPPNHLFLPNPPHILEGNSYSLMQTILYPSSKHVYETDLAFVKLLLKELEFEEAIDQLATIGENDWYKELSSGQKQKIAIISCLIKQPDAVFLDEPFAAMDNASRTNAVYLLQKYLPNAIILYIEHKHGAHNVYNGEIQIIEEAF